MADRLTRIYTRSGDDGFTGLVSGERVGKDCLLIKAQGDLDELNASIACILAHNENSTAQSLLMAIQHHLFNIGGELSAPQCDLIQAADVAWLEQWIDFFNQSLPPLKEFILPGGNAAVAQCHLSRTICRRAERHLVEWSRQNNLRAELLKYINRLSDLLFVLCRYLEAENKTRSTYWNKHLQLPMPG